jgi:multidrug efflux pump
VAGAFATGCAKRVAADRSKSARQYRHPANDGQNPNTRLINFDWNEPMKSLRIQVDQDRVRQLGVSSQSLSEALNAVATGMVVTQVRGSIYLTDLVARSPDEQRTSLETLRNLQVALDNGQTIPLSQVATIQYKLEQP